MPGAPCHAFQGHVGLLAWCLDRPLALHAPLDCRQQVVPVALESHLAWLEQQLLGLGPARASLATGTPLWHLLLPQQLLLPPLPPLPQLLLLPERHGNRAKRLPAVAGVLPGNAHDKHPAAVSCRAVPIDASALMKSAYEPQNLSHSADGWSPPCGVQVAVDLHIPDLRSAQAKAEGPQQNHKGLPNAAAGSFALAMPFVRSLKGVHLRCFPSVWPYSVQDVASRWVAEMGPFLATLGLSSSDRISCLGCPRWTCGSSWNETASPGK